MHLTSEQIQSFHRQGYLVVENLLDDKALAAIRAEYTTLMDKLYADWQAKNMVPEATSDMNFWDKLSECYKAGFDWYQPFDISLPHADITDETPMHFGPAVFEMVTNPNILDIAESLLGSEITSNPIQHVRIKPPEHLVNKDEIRAHIVATDWHQDMGVTLPEADESKFITIWLAITDATLENGCLQVASGQYDTLLPHCARKQTGIADGFLSEDSVRPLPVKAGGAVIFSPFTPHASRINESNGFRWSFDLRFNVTGHPTGRSHFPEFIARSKSAPQTELRDWKEWRKMWEDTRHKVAHSEHIEQHRWSSDGPYCA